MSATRVEQNKENVEIVRAPLKEVTADPGLDKNAIISGNNVKRKPLAPKFENNQQPKGVKEHTEKISKTKSGFENCFGNNTGKSTAPPKIHQDLLIKIPSGESTDLPKKCHQMTQTLTTTGSDSSSSLVSSSSDNESFYKELAERRREALNESLKENEEIWLELEAKNEKIGDLEEKIVSLEETVEKARKVSEMIAPFFNNADDTDVEYETELEPKNLSESGITKNDSLDHTNDSTNNKCSASTEDEEKEEDETEKN